MRFLVRLGLLEGGDLGFGQQDVILRHFGFESLEAVFHRGQIVALPHAAHTSGRDRQAPPLQHFRHPHLAPGRLLNRQVDRRLFDFRRGAVLQNRFAAADLLQRQLAAFVIQLLEAVKAVPAVAHHLTGLAHVTKLFGQFEQTDLRSDNLLVLGHSRDLRPAAGRRAVPASGENRAPPSGSVFGKTNNECQIKFKLLQIIGAVCPARDTGVALVMTPLNTAAMNLFLAELSQAVASGAHGIVLMDKAGWHTAGELRVPENLSLVFLPPYSPELNPIERLWLHLRDNRLSHRVFQTTEGIIDSCCEAWNWLLAETGRIRSLCSYPWLQQVSS